MNRFIECGRLTDRHKNKINTEQTLNRLNQIAKEKINEQNRDNKYLCKTRCFRGDC